MGAVDVKGHRDGVSEELSAVSLSDREGATVEVDSETGGGTRDGEELVGETRVVGNKEFAASGLVARLGVRPHEGICTSVWLVVRD